mmetsp:Transcript_9957/g.21265  ORF Transcript_9957/g.21265 Transcript_9957/m.21265 type:complete len:270 (-) Transcript_9957:557-1366(-)
MDASPRRRRVSGTARPSDADDDPVGGRREGAAPLRRLRHQRGRAERALAPHDARRPALWRRRRVATYRAEWKRTAQPVRPHRNRNRRQDGRHRWTGWKAAVQRRLAALNVRAVELGRDPVLGRRPRTSHQAYCDVRFGRPHPRVRRILSQGPLLEGHAPALHLWPESELEAPRLQLGGTDPCARAARGGGVGRRPARLHLWRLQRQRREEPAGHVGRLLERREGRAGQMLRTARATESALDAQFGREAPRLWWIRRIQGAPWRRVCGGR